jgi:hypothetical protein
MARCRQHRSGVDAVGRLHAGQGLERIFHGAACR